MKDVHLSCLCEDVELVQEVAEMHVPRVRTFWKQILRHQFLVILRQNTSLKTRDFAATIITQYLRFKREAAI